MIEGQPLHLQAVFSSGLTGHIIYKVQCESKKNPPQGT